MRKVSGSRPARPQERKKKKTVRSLGNIEEIKREE